MLDATDDMLIMFPDFLANIYDLNTVEDKLPVVLPM